MTDQERYRFDLQGFIAVPDALTPEQLSAINTIVDQQIAAQCEPDMTTKRFGGLLAWGQVFRDVIDNPRISPYLEEIIHPAFRLDHDYLDVIRSGLSPIGAGLHGGGAPFDPGQFFRFQDGRFYNGLCVVAYNLHDVNPGDGGFACVPGSHKANLRFPNEWRDLTKDHDVVTKVSGPAGTAIIFTEALTHGPLPWTGAHERRTLFLKFSPYNSSWSSRYYDAEAYEGLSDRAKEILEPPMSLSMRRKQAR